MAGWLPATFLVVSKFPTIGQTSAGAAPTRDVGMLCNMYINIYIYIYIYLLIYLFGVSVKMINPPKMDILIILILKPNFDGFTWVQFDFE